MYIKTSTLLRKQEKIENQNQHDWDSISKK